ncbi:hypothetical protein [Cryptosporangium japonicum]|uniref:Uncharacterized protein n=1 Tax=Cryptosporangium japonicum TaxID=80872 RepID=A0ABP3E4U7_9ACTN
MTQSPPSKAPELLVSEDTTTSGTTDPAKKRGLGKAAGVAGAAALAVATALVRRKRRAAATPSPWYRRTGRPTATRRTGRR